MNLASILELLRTRTGLEPDALGMQTVLAGVRSRMNALGSSDANAYAVRLLSDSVEFSALIDVVVVPETWFFRGGELFDYLAAHVCSALQARPANSVFRVLSLPCSTGEEPYSLALALTERGCAGGYAIEGVDISSRNLDEARRGVFGELSFRQMSPVLRNRYFRAVPDGWELDPTLRRSVRFLPGNLLDPAGLGSATYDLILCRNLFIYLGPTARQRALDNLVRLLVPDGLLGMGYAEPIDRAEGRFEPIGPGELFLYRKSSRRPTPPCPPIMPLRFPPRPEPPLPFPRRTIAQPAKEIPTIDRARIAADRGNYAEAHTLCTRLLEESGPDPDVYALMGVIQQARHLSEEARQLLERALYLSPDHREALFHLLLLHQQRGDVDRAAVLRRRLERCSPES